MTAALILDSLQAVGDTKPGWSDMSGASSAPWGTGP